MSERDELQHKYEAAKKKLEQTEHRLQKLENEMKYLERKRSDEDRRRTHIVAHKGGVIEDLFPESKGLEPQEFYRFFTRVMEHPEVVSVMRDCAQEIRNEREEGG